MAVRCNCNGLNQMTWHILDKSFPSALWEMPIFYMIYLINWLERNICIDYNKKTNQRRNNMGIWIANDDGNRQGKDKVGENKVNM